MNSSIQARREALGSFGDKLYDYITEHAPYHLTQFNGSVDHDFPLYERRQPALSALGGIVHTAVSVLALPFPLQIHLSEADVISLVHLAYGPPVLGERASDWPALKGYVSASKQADGEYGFVGSKLIKDKNFRKKMYPYKSAPAAGVKKNLSTSSLLQSFAGRYGTRWLGRLASFTAGLLTDDQLQMVILWGAATEHHFGMTSYWYATQLATGGELTKGLSVVLKAVGANSTRNGSFFTEGDSLLGRGVKPVDWLRENSSRTDSHLVAEQVVDVDPEAIRPHIRKILDTELPDDCVLPDIDDFWTSRWAWCVNGSQNEVSNRVLGIDLAGYGTHERFFRRMAAEAVKDEPVTGWDGVTHASPSSKLEAGKTRAIYSCDTRSYFAFSYILNDVQKRWKNRRVLLDPGQGGTLGVAQRIRGIMRHGTCHLMLDYDNFNSQHSNSTMSTVFEELCDKYNAPLWYREKLVSSFHNTYLHTREGISKVLGTLMSGHRATTFINSVLNAAYLRLAGGAEWYDNSYGFHTGDDVYLRAGGLVECGNILARARKLGLRMNPTKQSIGRVTAEFLRCAHGSNNSRGYLCRSLPALVNGNWANDKELSPRDALSTLVTSCRSVTNRSQGGNIGWLIAASSRHEYGLKRRVLTDILNGRVALGNGPCFNFDDYIVSIEVKEEVRPPPENDRRWPACATLDYLGKHCTDLERRAFALALVDPTQSMVYSSYSKGYTAAESQEDQAISFGKITTRQGNTMCYAEDLTSVRVESGVLAGFPLIQLIKSQLSVSQLSELCLLAGSPAPPTRVYEHAFGEASRSHNFLAVMPYADAAALQARTTADTIVSAIPLYM